MSKTSVLLRIDSNFKATVQNLYVVSAQVPSLSLDSETLVADGAAVFRVAREYALDHAFDEIQVVELEDILRTLRFICWMFTCHEQPMSNERTALLRQLLASIVLQTQAQQHSFESLLKTFGIARQLEAQLNHSDRVADQSANRSGGRPGDRRPNPEQEISLKLHRTDRIQQTKIRISADGVEMTSTVAEQTWTAQATQKFQTQKTP